MKRITIKDNELVIDEHCFDYFTELTNEQIFGAVDGAKEGFVTIGGSKHPTVLGHIGMDWYGFVIDPDMVIITVLTLKAYEWNKSEHSSLTSVPAEVEHIN